MSIILLSNLIRGFWVLYIVLFSLHKLALPWFVYKGLLTTSQRSTFGTTIGFLALLSMILFISWFYQLHQKIRNIRPDYPFSPGDAFLLLIPIINFLFLFRFYFSLVKFLQEFGGNYLEESKKMTKLLYVFMVVIVLYLVYWFLGDSLIDLFPGSRPRLVNSIFIVVFTFSFAVIFIRILGKATSSITKISNAV